MLKTKISVFTKINRIWQWSWTFKFLLIEAVCYSLIIEIYLKLKISGPIKAWYTRKEIDKKLSEKEVQTIKQVSKAIKLIEKYAPWKPECYNRALTTKRMLSKRKIETTMHVGFRKTDSEIIGHAWLSHNGILVTGFIQGIEEYVPLKAKDTMKIND